MSSDKLVVTALQKKAIGVAIIIALLGGALFLRPYFALIIVSIILAFLFSPIYDALLRRTGKSGQAATLTFLSALLTIAIPIALILYFSVKQIDSLLMNTDYATINQTIQELIASLNRLYSDANIQIDVAELSKNIESTLKTAGKSVLSSTPALFSSFFGFLTSFIIFIYVFLSLLKNNDKIINLVNTINPLGKDISEIYIAKMSAMTKATVRGQFIIAFCQGFESALVLSIAGFGDAFFFFAMLLTAISVVPMGAGIITIPIGLLLIMTGDVMQGILIIVNHLVIVTNIDNILRPRLVPKEARLDPALMILAVFAGMFYFGFMGIVLGPVIMIVIVTTIEVYLEVYRDIEMKRHVPSTNNKGLFKRVKSHAKEIFDNATD